MSSAANSQGVRVGVLALQGAYAAHARLLTGLGAQAVAVRSPADLYGLDALVLPGGESTSMLRLLERNQLLQPLARAVTQMPGLGTCAGLILQARQVMPEQPSLAAMDISVQRNAYGRQLESRIVNGQTALAGGDLEMVFIRAPRITRAGPGVEVLACYQGDPVLVRQGGVIGCAFHPELGRDERVHGLLLALLA